MNIDRKILQWELLQQQIDEFRQSEVTLRKEIFEELFKNPKEGINNHNLGNGFTLKATYRLNRSIDEAALSAVKEKLGRSLDNLIKYKPELKTGEYRKMGNEDRHIFDEALIIKPGLPSLEIVYPKKEK